MAKSWTEKLHSKRPPSVETLERPMMGMPAGTRLYIATPMIIKTHVDAIPKGSTTTIAEIRESLAKENGADATCPLTTGIFLRIVAEHSFEEMNAGKTADDVTPFWRAIDPKSPLAKKFSGGPELLRSLREREGI